MLIGVVELIVVVGVLLCLVLAMGGSRGRTVLFCLTGIAGLCLLAIVLIGAVTYLSMGKTNRLPVQRDSSTVMAPDGSTVTVYVDEVRHPGRADLSQATESERKILKALDEKIDLDLNEIPLIDVIEYLKQRHGIEIQLDGKSLEDEGIAPDTSVSRTVRGVALRSALRLILSELDLAYVIENEVLLITTRTQAEKKRTAQAHAETDLVIPSLQGDPGGEQRPPWVDEPAGRSGDVYHRVLTVGPYTSREECDQKLPEAVEGLLAEYATSMIDLGLFPGEIPNEFTNRWQSHVVRDTWQETVRSSVGPMIQLHARVEIDGRVRAALKQLAYEYDVRRRLIVTGICFAGVLGLIAGGYGLLKLDITRRGRAARLQGAGAAVILLGMVGGAGSAVI